MHKNDQQQFNNLELPILNKAYQLYKILYKYLKNFPKRERYSLGEKIENILLEIIELTVMANSLSKGTRGPILQKLNGKIEVEKIIIRLCFNLDIIKTNQYLLVQNILQEIGKMTGGWIKAEKNN